MATKKTKPLADQNFKANVKNQIADLYKKVSALEEAPKVLVHEHETVVRDVREHTNQLRSQAAHLHELDEKMGTPKPAAISWAACGSDKWIAREDLNRVVRALTTCLYLYPHYNLRYRCNAGAVMEAIELLRPDVALVIRDESAEAARDKFFPEEYEPVNCGTCESPSGECASEPCDAQPAAAKRRSPGWLAEWTKSADSTFPSPCWASSPEPTSTKTRHRSEAYWFPTKAEAESWIAERGKRVTQFGTWNVVEDLVPAQKGIFFATNRPKFEAGLERVGRDLCAYVMEGEVGRASCDCKYGIGAYQTKGLNAGSEQTGCPEVHMALAMIHAMTDSEYAAILGRAGGMLP